MRPTDRDDRDDGEDGDEDASDLVAAGLYDPDAPDAPARRELLGFLLDEVGASIPELVQAEEEDRILTLAAFRAIRPPARLTLAEAAARAVVPVDVAAQVWRAAGFREPRPHERRFGEADVEMFALFGEMQRLLGDENTLQVARTVGQATAQVADAVIASLRSTMEAPLADDRRWVEIARMYLAVVETMFPRFVHALEALQRHQFDAVARRYQGSRPTATNVVPLAVGFADMCGFTDLSAKLDAEGLGRMLARFEAVTGDSVTGAGGNVVKRIGDALMFVSNAPGVACAVALDLLEACARAGLPRLRGGVAFGDVIVRHGDFYGPVVNLASRLVSAAEPGTVLADAALHGRLARIRGPYAFVPAGRIRLHGFAEPAETYQLLRP